MLVNSFAGESGKNVVVVSTLSAVLIDPIIHGIVSLINPVENIRSDAITLCVMISRSRLPRLPTGFIVPVPDPIGETLGDPTSTVSVLLDDVGHFVNHGANVVLVTSVIFDGTNNATSRRIRDTIVVGVEVDRYSVNGLECGGIEQVADVGVPIFQGGFHATTEIGEIGGSRGVHVDGHTFLYCCKLPRQSWSPNRSTPATGIRNDFIFV